MFSCVDLGWLGAEVVFAVLKKKILLLFLGSLVIMLMKSS